MNYTAHPVVAMLLPEVSADYPGAASSFVEQALPGAVCLFTNGAAGNIISIKVSTNFEDVAALGRKLGQAALETIGDIRRGAPLADTRSRSFKLKPRAWPPLAEALKRASPLAPGKDGTLTRLALWPASVHRVLRHDASVEVTAKRRLRDFFLRPLARLEFGSDATV